MFWNYLMTKPYGIKGKLIKIQVIYPYCDYRTMEQFVFHLMIKLLCPSNKNKYNFPL